MKDIYSVLAQKQSELAALAREVEALRIAAKLLSDEKVSKADTENMSQPQMVVSILEAADKDLHVKEIAAEMRKRFKKDVQTNNLSVLLYRYASRNRHFYKASGKPNTYGLLKWKAEPPKVVEMK